MNQLKESVSADECQRKELKHEALVESIRFLIKSVNKLDNFIDDVKGTPKHPEPKSEESKDPLMPSLSDTLTQSPKDIMEQVERINMYVDELKNILF